MSQLMLPGVERTNPESDPNPTFDRKIEQRLVGSGYRALHNLSCLVNDDVVYLRGCLPSQYLKQVAQEIALGMEGVRQVINEIEVSRPGRRTVVNQIQRSRT